MKENNNSNIENKPTKKVWDRKLHRKTITLMDKGKTYNVQRSGNEWTIRDLNGMCLSLTKDNLEAILGLEG